MLAYTAGFVDGEGSIGFYGGSIRLTVVNTYLQGLRWMQEAFGGAIGKKSRRDAKHRRVYALTLYGEKAERAMLWLSPFLREKNAQVRLALRLVSTPPPDRAPLIAKLQALKRIESIE